jgi:hypothetical protein
MMNHHQSNGLRAAAFLLMTGASLPAPAQAGPGQPPQEETTASAPADD